jgi:hypothetical protein
MELMLEMLMLDSQQDYMTFIEPRLFKFLQTKSIMFYKFFDQACRKFEFRIVAQQKLDQIFFIRATQYVNWKNLD